MTLVKIIDKRNLNWSLCSVSHLRQGKLLDCNQIQGHVAGQNWRLFLVMIWEKLKWSDKGDKTENKVLLSQSSQFIPAALQDTNKLWILSELSAGSRG